MKKVIYKWWVYKIPIKVQEKYWDELHLIFIAQSMDNEDKQYWLETLATMTDEQADRLFNILAKEKIELERVEKEYLEWIDWIIKQINEAVFKWQITTKEKDIIIRTVVKNAKEKVNKNKNNNI